MTKLSARKYDDDDSYYVVNEADRDRSLDSVAGAPAIIQELRTATIEIILRNARNPGEIVAKVTTNRSVKGKVSGYATFLKYIRGSDLDELERRLGMRAGVLQSGAYLYEVDPFSLNAGNIGPRGNTDWSAGVSPRDVDNVRKQQGVAAGYHRDYPTASKPIIQFIIYDQVPYIGSPRFIRPGEKV